MQKRLVFFSSILPLLLTSCATYHAKPLTQAAINQHLQAPNTQALANEALKENKIKIDFSKPLTPEELSIIAVLNDPDLIALRSQEGVSQAQVFSAGLLPDPVFSPSYAYPLAGSGTTDAYSFGLNYDIGALVLRHWQVEAAEDQATQVHDNVAWQEWLIANQAHLLAIQIGFQQVQLNLAEQNLKFAQALMQLTKKNLLNHNDTLTDWITRQSNYFDAADQATTLSRSLEQNRIDLNHLLGFPPDTKINIAAINLTIPGQLNATHLFDQAQNTRLDLKALRAGYQNQEIQLHQAILGQFPHFNLGLVRARDNTDTNSMGIGLTFDLPIWNRNRGQIAIQTATREQLYNEYMARVQQTRSDIATLVSDVNLLKQEAIALQTSALNFSEPKISAAFKSGQINIATYADLINGDITKKQHLLTVQQTLAEQCVALQIAVGKPLQGASC